MKSEIKMGFWAAVGVLAAFLLYGFIGRVGLGILGAAE